MRENCSFIDTPFTQNFNYYWKKLRLNSNTRFIMGWCSKLSLKVILKDIIMEIQKVLVNDFLRVSKVS